MEAELEDLVLICMQEVRTFIQIMYGCCVRFYSTVVDWEYIQIMSEDLMERMTSKIFEDRAFSELMTQLCGELTREEDAKYLQLKMKFA